MLKKTQNYLLLNHSLLWNIKFVPVFIITVLINIIFFVSGYIDGEIDFTRTEDYRYHSSVPEIVVFLSIILSAIVLILWIVFYIRNNAFKTFYQKKRISLFKEWLLIFILCIINCSYFICFMYAYELRAKHYYDKEELVRRLDIITKASIFTNSGYQRPADTIINNREKKRKNFTYSGKTYQFGSLLNKTMETFSLQGDVKDSITIRKVRSWLVENRKDSIYNTLKAFDNLAKEHALKGNITTDQWMALVYDYPDFPNKMIVGENYYSPVYGYSSDRHYDEYQDEYLFNEEKIDLSMNLMKIEKKDTTYSPKYYVPQDQLNTAYSAMSKAWVNPDADAGVLGGLVYFAMGISVLLFSFRVTSGKSWLIAGVAGGIAVVITALICLTTSKLMRRWGTAFLLNDEYLFLVIWLVIVLVLLAYYFITLRRKAKSISAIILNVLIWLLPFVLPVVYSVLLEYAESLNTDYTDKMGELTTIEHPLYTWLHDHMGTMLYLNLIFVVVYMYFFTISIKKWKGLAEG